MRCWVALPGEPGEEKGERCPGEAVLECYGLPFCEVHGAEVRAGATAELNQDASEFFEGLDNDQVPEGNPEAMARVRAAVRELTEATNAANKEEQEALRRAYPYREELVDSETLHFDYYDPEDTNYGTPLDWYFRDKWQLHKLMRVAHQAGQALAVEALEPLRESAAEQLAYALELGPSVSDKA